MTPDDARLPPLVAWLGYGGLLPFAALSVAIALHPQGSGALQAALLQYAGLILSFVGALHWGLALRLPAGRLRNLLLAWSVVPCLIAWLALQLPAVAAALVLEYGYALHWAFDRKLARGAGAPAWYPALRPRLTAGAMAALLLPLLHS